MVCKIYLKILLGIFLFFLLNGCNQCHGDFSESEKIKIVSWNVQTFFDATTSGLEYDEFKGKNSPWSEEKYKARLERLCKTMAYLNPDIFVLQEIESQSVMYDIVNQLYAFMPQDKIYTHMQFSQTPKDAIGCGVFSRFPLGKMSLHQLDSRIYGQQPSLRPLMELEVRSADDSEEIFRLFVCHWKSKSGGEEDADLWQKEQAKILSLRLENLKQNNPSIPAIACGDFNRDLQEFYSLQDCSCCLLIHETPVKSSWLYATETPDFSEDLSAAGSYWYQNQWERIDHFFLYGNISFENFSVRTDGDWCIFDEQGTLIPYRYSVWNGQGYSDHLPIECSVSLH